MKQTLIVIFFMAISSLAFSSPTTTIDVTVSLRAIKGDNSRLSLAEMSRLLKEKRIIKHRRLFTLKERAILKNISLSFLAHSYVVTLKAKDLSALRRQFPLLAIDPNDLEIKKTDFSELQWPLKNNGIPQTIELDHIHNRQITGVSSEDIGKPSKNIKPIINTDIIVAVLDTGLQKDHPDLKERLVRKESECQALEKFKSCLKAHGRKKCEETWFDVNHPEVDLDGNGYPLDCNGWSLLGGLNSAGIMGRPDFSDDQGHGTHVSGIIAAAKNNNTGIQGCSENLRILPVQVLGKKPNEPIKPLSVTSDSSHLISPKEAVHKGSRRTLADIVARGVIYAISSGANIINFSMGWPQSRDSEFMRTIIAEAQKRNITIVAAAGNDSTKALLRPCSYPGVICSASHGPDGAISSFSNYGSGVDIAAPGLNILSTWPENKRPVRFRATHGYEFLHGTSQASPYVACAVGEILSRGHSPRETYARLIAGARPHVKESTLQEKNPHQHISETRKHLLKEEKFTMSGNLDIQRALHVKPQPVILPYTKEKIHISWPETQKSIQLSMQFKNFWLRSAKTSVKVQIVSPTKTSLKLGPLLGKTENWKEEEVRAFKLTLLTTHANRDSLSSEITLKVSIKPQGHKKRDFYVPVIFTTPIDKNFFRKGVAHFKIKNPLKTRLSILPIDQRLDRKQHFIDYFFAEYNDQWTYHLVTQDEDGSYTRKNNYSLTPKGENLDALREQFLIRFDYNMDGHSDYAIGLFDPTGKTSFHILNSELQLLDKFEINNDISPLSHEIHWMALRDQNNGHHKKVPAWLGTGKEPAKKITLKELWENPQGYEPLERRLYYLNGKHELQAFQKHQGFNVADILENSLDQKIAGQLLLLFSKNLGTEQKYSFINEFAIGVFENGQITSFYPLNPSSNSFYNDIAGSRVGPIHNLHQGDPFIGNFWFSNSRSNEQSLSWFLPKDMSFSSADLFPLRGVVDNVLWVRSFYQGQHNGVKKSGAFSLTNSEIQYHDLITKQTVKKSIERYTFYQSMLTTNFYSPITLSSKSKNGFRQPALFTAEGTLFHKGLRFIVPEYSNNGNLTGLRFPLNLRMAAQNGCRSIDTPVWLGEDKGYYIDFYCRDRFIRVPLEL